jgi:hypothetical protein
LFKIKIWSKLVQESIFPAIVTLDNTSSRNSTNLIPEQFFQSKQMVQFCSDLRMQCDVNILGGSTHTVKENAEALVVATMEIGLEVNADKSKYIIVSRDQNAGRNHRIKPGNSSLESIEQFRCLVTTLTNKNFMQKEIKCRLKSGSTCYNSVQNLLSYSLLSKNIKIKNYRIIILPVVLHGYENGHSYWEERS